MENKSYHLLLAPRSSTVYAVGDIDREYSCTLKTFLVKCRNLFFILSLIFMYNRPVVTRYFAVNSEVRVAYE